MGIDDQKPEVVQPLRGDIAAAVDLIGIKEFNRMLSRAMVGHLEKLWKQRRSLSPSMAIVLAERRRVLSKHMFEEKKGQTGTCADHPVARYKAKYNVVKGAGTALGHNIESEEGGCGSATGPKPEEDEEI